MDEVVCEIKDEISTMSDKVDYIDKCIMLNIGKGCINNDMLDLLIEQSELLHEYIGLLDKKVELLTI